MSGQVRRDFEANFLSVWDEKNVKRLKNHANHGKKNTKKAMKKNI